jgi:hypothetical protein
MIATRRTRSVLVSLLMAWPLAIPTEELISSDRQSPVRSDRRAPRQRKPCSCRAFAEHPQRDSNPCRHLESSSRAVRPVRPGAESPVLSGFPVRAVRRDRPRHTRWITKRITNSLAFKNAAACRDAHPVRSCTCPSPLAPRSPSA